MQDEYAGQPGTYIVDPDKGVRIPLEKYEAEQAAKTASRAAPKTAPKTTEEENP